MTPLGEEGPPATWGRGAAQAAACHGRARHSPQASGSTGMHTPKWMTAVNKILEKSRSQILEEDRSSNTENERHPEAVRTASGRPQIPEAK